KARAELRPLQRRNLAAGMRLSSCRQGQPRIRDHASVAPARGAVRKKMLAVVGTAPGRRADVPEPQRAPLLHQHVAQIQPARPGLGATGELREHFRTYFITRAANSWATMHYNIAGAHERLPLHELHAALQNPPPPAAPPGVQQRD